VGEILPDRDELARRCRALQEDGARVVLTNGTYDLLHVGHLRSLVDARSRGDLLVVGVNADSSVRGYKGPGRPVIPEAERCEMLAALSCVDFVHVFAEPDVEALLRALRPDVYAKGRDYTLETLPERAVAEEVGAEIAFVGDPKDHSVTDILQRVRALPAE
jgi:rfaE bifunctional protein nucleotidyltransferase chain/domain